jgi:hypothetical protein
MIAPCIILEILVVFGVKKSIKWKDKKFECAYASKLSLDFGKSLHLNMRRVL